MILEFEKIRTDLEDMRHRLKDVGEGLHIDHMQEELEELREEQNADGFWENLDRSTHVTRKIKQLEDKIAHYAGLNDQCDDIEVMMELAEEEDDSAMVTEVTDAMEKLRTETEALELETLMRGPYDDRDAVLSLHAGAGGTEAQDWTSMLYRMYTRYCEHMGFTVKLLDILDGDEAGLKSVTFEVSGDHVYGFLRGEKGVHRLVRISPFDSNARRHTSFASLDVAPLLEEDDGEIEIDMKYVRVDTYHSSGAGGQNVNKTSSAVRMTYVKDDVTIVVACQTERDQVQNRATCLKMLKSKLLEIREREREQQMADIKGEMKKIEWGSQIRSYVFQPYTMVKDHRTGYETSAIDDVMNGALDGFTVAYLKMQ